MGHSRARWDGDVLEVNVEDFNDRSWLDASGNHHSTDLKVLERYTLVDANTLRARAATMPIPGEQVERLQSRLQRLTSS